MTYAMRSRCLRVLLLLALLVSGSSAFATQRALLVGVSELVNQPQALWLQAPRNDVMLMRDALQKQGFAAADITVLADGVSGAALPESQAIHEALGRLLAQSRSGDFVLLYFSGHGTRLRDVAKRYQEPDGLSENFLARDVRGTPGSDNVLTGDLRDADFDAWIQAFLARNVFVASIFDTCSANSMTRSAADTPATTEGAGDDEVRWRGLRTAQLLGAPGPAARTAVARPVVTDPVPRARYVALFASESHQITPELRLPRKSRNARPQGLLTWAVVEALGRRPATWRELFDGVLSVYPPVIDELAQRFPTRELPSPVAEGNLDAPLFANRAQAASTRPVWRAQRSGDTLTLQAGQLDGLVAQHPQRGLATKDDGTLRSAQGTLAHLRVCRAVDRPLDREGYDLSVRMLLPGMIDDAVNQQRPVLHDPDIQIPGGRECRGSKFVVAQPFFHVIAQECHIADHPVRLACQLFVYFVRDDVAKCLALGPSVGKHSAVSQCRNECMPRFHIDLNICVFHG